MHLIERLKMLFGFLLLFVLGGLAVSIALGKVEEKTSYGLQLILGTLSTMAGMFGSWAFREKRELTKDEVSAWLESPEGQEFLASRQKLLPAPEAAAEGDDK